MLASSVSTWMREMGSRMPSLQCCVGYRQAWSFVDGLIDAETLRTTAIAATRQLAKRQFTWLRATPATAFEPSAPGLAERVSDFLSRNGLRG